MLYHQRFSKLQGRPLPALFDLGPLHPARLQRIVHEAAETGVLNFRDLSPCGQLAAFRLMRDQGKVSDTMLDRWMTRWLARLGACKDAKINQISVPRMA